MDYMKKMYFYNVHIHCIFINYANDYTTREYTMGFFHYKGGLPLFETAGNRLFLD